MYGLLNRSQLFQIIDDVVNTIGGGQNAVELLRETANVESAFGSIPYNPLRGYGLGVFQFDKIGFDDTIARTPKNLKELIRIRYKIDLDKLQYSDLVYSPLVSTILARLKYRLVPSKIPSTKAERALYWYKWYNGGGVGTPEEGYKYYMSKEYT